MSAQALMRRVLQPDVHKAVGSSQQQQEAAQTVISGAALQCGQMQMGGITVTVNCHQSGDTTYATAIAGHATSDDTVSVSRQGGAPQRRLRIPVGTRNSAQYRISVNLQKLGHHQQSRAGQFGSGAQANVHLQEHPIHGAVIDAMRGAKDTRDDVRIPSERLLNQLHTFASTSDPTVGAAAARAVLDRAYKGDTSVHKLSDRECVEALRSELVPKEDHKRQALIEQVYGDLLHPERQALSPRDDQGDLQEQLTRDMTMLLRDPEKQAIMSDLQRLDTPDLDSPRRFGMHMWRQADVYVEPASRGQLQLTIEHHSMPQPVTVPLNPALATRSGSRPMQIERARRTQTEDDAEITEQMDKDGALNAVMRGLKLDPARLQQADDALKSAGESATGVHAKIYRTLWGCPDAASRAAYLSGLERHLTGLRYSGDTRRGNLLMGLTRVTDFESAESVAKFAGTARQMLRGALWGRKLHDPLDSVTVRAKLPRESEGGERYGAQMTSRFEQLQRLAGLEVEVPEHYFDGPHLRPDMRELATAEVTPMLDHLLLGSLLSHAAERAGLKSAPALSLFTAGEQSRTPQHADDVPHAAARSLLEALGRSMTRTYHNHDQGLVVSTEIDPEGMREVHAKLRQMVGPGRPLQAVQPLLDGLEDLSRDKTTLKLVAPVRLRAGEALPTPYPLTPDLLSAARGASSGEGIADGYAQAALTGQEATRVIVSAQQPGKPEDQRLYRLLPTVHDANVHEMDLNLHLLREGAHSQLTGAVGDVMNHYFDALGDHQVEHQMHASAEIKAAYAQLSTLDDRVSGTAETRQLGGLMGRNFLDLALSGAPEEQRRGMTGALMGGGAGAVGRYRNSLMSALSQGYFSVLGIETSQPAKLQRQVDADPKLTHPETRQSLWQLGQLTNGALLHGPAMLAYRTLHPEVAVAPPTEAGENFSQRMFDVMERRSPTYAGETQRDYERRASHTSLQPGAHGLGDLWKGAPATVKLADLHDKSGTVRDMQGLSGEAVRGFFSGLLSQQPDTGQRSAHYSALDEVLSQATGGVWSWTGSRKRGLLLSPSVIPSRPGLDDDVQMSSGELLGAYAWHSARSGQDREVHALLGKQPYAPAEELGAEALARWQGRHHQIVQNFLHDPAFSNLPPAALELLPSKGLLVDIARHMGHEVPRAQSVDDALQRSVHAALEDRLDGRPGLIDLPRIYTRMLSGALKHEQPLTRQDRDDALSTLRVTDHLTQLCSSQAGGKDLQAPGADLRRSRGLKGPAAGELCGALEHVVNTMRAIGEDGSDVSVTHEPLLHRDGSVYASRMVMRRGNVAHHLVMSPQRPMQVGAVDSALEHFEVRPHDGGADVHHDVLSNEYKHSVSGQTVRTTAAPRGLRRSRGQALVHKKDDDFAAAERLRTLKAVMDQITTEHAGAVTLRPRVYQVTESYNRVLKRSGVRGAAVHQIEHRPGSTLPHAMSYATLHGDNFFGVERSFEADRDLGDLK